MKLLAVGWWFPVLVGTLAGEPSSISVEDLRCEYRENPMGMDVRLPRLSWVLRSSERGERQTAYQILVASTPERLSEGRADLWDSGKVVSDDSVHVVYGGTPLTSRLRCHWKVRAWDARNQESAWSPPAFWTMGLLEASDWKAAWIADAGTNADVVIHHPANGYHSELATAPHSEKWVMLDLGTSRLVDEVRLFPACPYDWQPDTPGFLFPRRFRVAVGDQADQVDRRIVIDCTAADVPNPGTNHVGLRFEATRVRFVRLEVTRLALRDGTNFGFALAELQALGGGQLLSRGAKVTASDSIQSGGWGLERLADDVSTTVPPTRDDALPATLFRRSFTVPKEASRATLYATALGVYEVRINGQRVGDHLLAPEWTNYRKRIQYQTYDVSGLLRTGRNTVAAMVGEGWYAGRLMLVGRGAYGVQPAFLLQLEIEGDGANQRIVTEASWQSRSDGPIRSSGIYDGEVYDARMERPGWDVGEDPSDGWRSAQVLGLAGTRSSGSTSLESQDTRLRLGASAGQAGSQPVSAADAIKLTEARSSGTNGKEHPHPALVWQPNEPIRVVHELSPVSVTEPKPGVYVFDLGQNMVGWCRVRGEGRAGEAVTIRHAEMLEQDGTVYTANLRAAPQVDRYIARQNGPFEFEPRFTYHGFRYVEVTGFAAAPAADAVVGRVFHSSAADTGDFECSEPLWNHLMRNIVWTQRGNLMSSPNDCPQRDERLGWMGDIQVFGQTAMFNMNLGAFFTKWLRDVRDDQAADGRFPDFAPHPGNPNISFSGAPAWADAGVIVPWHAYVNYGDSRLLEEHFEAARRWVDYVQDQNPDLLWRQSRHNDYNDWLNGDWIKQTGWPAQGAAVTNEILATAFFAHSTELVSRMARVLHRDADAMAYAERARKIREAFIEAFVKPDGRIAGETQAGYALALNFDLLPESLRPAAARHLVEGIERYGGHLSTGIQSTHRLMLELTRAGHHDLACRLATNRSFPSWGYMIENGATTIWERWDGFVRGRGFQDAGMNSFNHWALGAVGEWVWRHVAGIQSDESNPGYRHVVIAPRPGAGVKWVRAEHRSIRGPVATNWKLERDRFNLEIEIPPGVTATVRVPGLADFRENGRAIAESSDVNVVRIEPDAVWLAVGSGRYRFDSVVGSGPR